VHLTIRIPGRKNEHAEAGWEKQGDVVGNEADLSDEEIHDELDQIHEGMGSLVIEDE